MHKSFHLIQGAAVAILMVASRGSFGQAMSEHCTSLLTKSLTPPPNESTEQLQARMDGLQKCVNEAQDAKKKDIPVLKSTGTCPNDLSYLDSRLPRYPSDPEYSKIRAMALHENMVEDLGKARNMGLTVADAADSAMAQAKVADAVEKRMADLARAYNSAGEATLVQLRNGTYRDGGRPLPIAFQGYLAAYVGAIVNREAAAAITCIARRN